MVGTVACNPLDSLRIVFDKYPGCFNVAIDVFYENLGRFDVLIDILRDNLGRLDVVIDILREHLGRFDVLIDIFCEHLRLFNGFVDGFSENLCCIDIDIDIADDAIDMVCNLQVPHHRHQTLLLRKHIQL